MWEDTTASLFMESIVGFDIGHLSSFCHVAHFVFNLVTKEEQDIKALQVKNRKLGEALDQRQASVLCSLTN